MDCMVHAVSKSWAGLSDFHFSLSEGQLKEGISDPFVVHEHDDSVFTLLRDMCLPPNLVTTSAHYLSDVEKKKKGSPGSLVGWTSAHLDLPELLT